MKATRPDLLQSNKLRSTTKHESLVIQHPTRNEPTATSNNRGHLPHQYHSTFASAEPINANVNDILQQELKNTPTLCKACKSFHVAGQCAGQQYQIPQQQYQPANCGSCSLRHVRRLHTCPLYSTELQLRLVLGNLRSMKGVPTFRNTLRTEFVKRAQRSLH